jgi:transcriptional regulator of nitric oxide reductase
LKKVALFVVLVCGVAAATPGAQFQRRRREPRSYVNPASPDVELRQLFPGAATFSLVESAPRHVTAVGAGGRSLGYAFWTTDLVPDERGYHGPIKILVGMNLAGQLTGVVVHEDTEPYGYFSVETPAFAKQFAGKSIRDGFRVGVDVDAVSRATLSIGSATRAIRDSSRTVARALLNPNDVK